MFAYCILAGGKGVYRSLVAAVLLTVLMEITLIVFSEALTPSVVVLQVAVSTGSPQ